MCPDVLIALRDQETFTGNFRFRSASVIDDEEVNATGRIGSHVWLNSVLKDGVVETAKQLFVIAQLGWGVVVVAVRLFAIDLDKYFAFIFLCWVRRDVQIVADGVLAIVDDLASDIMQW